MKHSCLILLLTILTYSAAAQFILSAEFRPRSEYTHGFKTLAAENSDYGLFTSQRTRLNFIYKNSTLSTKISLQDIRVFGNTKQLNETDGLTSIHEAWAETKLADYLSVRIGRQELVYDDSRMLGNVNWAQQGRSHDLFLLKYENKIKLHGGLAFNMHEPILNSTIYNLAGNYKAMQFLWFHQDMKKFKYSILLLNSGMQSADNEGNPVVSYSTTAGGRFEYPTEKYSVHSNFYYQGGKDPMNQNLSAFNFLAEVKYLFNKKMNLVAGVEYLSGGNELNENQETVNHAFNPLYGTNHIFNGHMDYYYVGNHINSVGLMDIYLKASYKLKDRSTIYLNLHSFSAASEIISPIQPFESLSRNLGYEIDFNLNYKINDMSSVTLGYSHYLGTASTELIKGGSKDEISNWAWVMFQFTPVFLQ
jgi:hypothetical protein